MNKKIYLYLIVILAIICILLSTSTAIATKEKNLIQNKTSYNYGFIIVETFSTSGSITGIPDYDHVGGLIDVDIITNGGSISVIFTSPIWGSAINYRNNDIQIHMDKFIGVTSYSNSEGCLVGIGNNITWELLD